MANEQNLRPPKSTKEARERGRKGGKASGEARRRRKSLGEAAQAAAKVALNDIGRQNLKRKGLSLDGIDPKDVDGIMALAMGQLIAGINGNSQAAQNFAEWLDLAQKHKREQLEIEKLQAEIDRLRMGSGVGSQDNEFLNAWKQSIIDGYKDSSDKDGEE
jgi:hypothetical protein